MRISPLLQAVLWMAAARWCACAQDLTVAVYDYAGVPAGEMSGAIRTARWAYRAAGIETNWVVCDFTRGGSESCARALPADGVYLELAVMPRRARTLATRLTHGEPAGMALVGPDFARPRAYAFYDVTKNAANLAFRPLDVVLGCVLVHESAHLLGLRHQAQGLMRDKIDAHDVDAAVAGHPFSVGEAGLLRNGVGKFESRGLSARK